MLMMYGTSDILWQWGSLEIKDDIHGLTARIINEYTVIPNGWQRLLVNVEKDH